MIVRSLTQQVIEDLSFFPIAGIVGPRQVGKTTFAKSLITNISKPVIYLDLELSSDIRRLDDAETYLKSIADKCVIIDEVQRMPKLFPLLRALTDIDRQPARYILLGSASPELIKNSSETLAGRISYSELMPFSILEVADQITWQEHWLRGGFPPALLAKKTTQSFRWLSSFLQSFAQRELQSLGYDIPPQAIARLLEMLSYVHGQLLNVSDLSRSLGLSQPTINRYLDLLEGAFIIHRLQSFHVNTSKRLVKSPKIYFRDSGVLHQLCQINDFNRLQGHPIVGASWEGYVIEQIKRVTNSVDWQFYFYRTHAGAETDLILRTPKGDLCSIEIKYTNSPSLAKSFYDNIGDLKTKHNFVIVPEAASYPKREGVQVVNLREFLEVHLLNLA